jgi:hypothetical protein
LLAIALLLAMSAPPAYGQRGFGSEARPRAPQTVEELEARYVALAEGLRQPPERDYKVEMLPAEKTKLHRADPKLLENKFAAALNLVAPAVHSQEHVNAHNWLQLRLHRPLDDSYPDDLRGLIALDQTYLPFPGAHFQQIAATELSDHHQLLVKRCPPDELREKQLVEFLTSEACDRDVTRGSRHARFGVAAWIYTIYAPTAEVAEQRAEALLRLLDCGMCRPLQQYHLAKGREALAATKESEAELMRLGEEIKALEAELAKPSEISADILNELKAQKIMVAVELSGLSARVKACDEMLKGTRDLPVSTIQSVSDMKIKAEIERVGIKEKLDQINKFIEEGDSRVVTEGRIYQKKDKREAVEKQLRRDRSSTETHADLVELYAPLQLQDNQLKIVPIEWTN